MKLTLGADPEFFLLDGDNKPVSAHDIVPGSKEEPYPIPGGAVQADGTAVEFNVWPSSSPEEFANNVALALRSVREMVPEKYRFFFRPVVEYDQVYFRKLPLRAKALGCDPDYNAKFGGIMNSMPIRVGTMRTGAGHIHIGWTEGANIWDREHIYDCCQAVNYLDETFGKVETAWCNDTKRRKMYGQPGAFRPKPYGVEYRVPSNAWLNYPKLWPWFHKVIAHALENLAEGQPPMSYGEPAFEHWMFARSVLPNGYPDMPIDIVEEKEPWAFHF